MIARIRLALICILSAAANYGCESGSDTTTGREVTLHTLIEADSAITESFETDTGWSVTLSKVAVSVGALYYFDGEPAFVLRQPASLLRHLAGLFSPSVAHAHPGHYVSGMATGQMTVAQASDLGTSTQLSEGTGVTGLYRSARFVLADADGGDALPELEGSVALAEGVALKDGQSVHFRLRASFADVSRSVRDGQVDGCVFEETQVQGDGAVTVTVNPRIWFNLVDFSGVEPGAVDQPTEIPLGAKPQLGFALGVVQLSAYHFSYRADE